MSDTINFDDKEKIDILLKSFFGVPSTSDQKDWSAEFVEKYNKGVNGSDLFLDEIPDQPDFDISGTIRTAAELGLQTTDFVNYSHTAAKSACSIVDDSTGTIRRFKTLILERCAGIGTDNFSWLKKANGKNILFDSLQFNFKMYNDAGGNVVKPYEYFVQTQSSLLSFGETIPTGSTGGSWVYDINSGILLFPDVNNLSSGPAMFQIGNTNKPVLTVYKYIGRKGISRLIEVGDGAPITSKDSICFGTNGDSFITFGTSTTAVNVPNGIISGMTFVNNNKIHTLFDNSDSTKKSILPVLDATIVDNSNVTFTNDKQVKKKIWVDQTNNILYVNNNTGNWVQIGGATGGTSVAVDTTRPATTTQGDLFYNTTDSKLEINIAADGATADWKGACGASSGGGSSFVNNSNQTFFDLITQQPAKFKKNGSHTASTSSVTINWNYDDILANQTNTILAKLSFQSLEKNKSLPFINEIKIDISGTTTKNPANSSTWLLLHTFTFGDTVDYNINTYKTFTFPKTAVSSANVSDVLNILSKTAKFDARVYGINFAEDYPDVNTRALLFEDLQFVEANAPTAPVFVSENTDFSTTIDLEYKVVEPEAGNAGSSAVVAEVQTEYNQSDTLSSSIYAVDNTTLTDTETKSASANANFSISLNSLRAGTKYNYKVKAKNDLRDLFSDFSTEKTSAFLRLPSDGGISTTLNFSASESKTYVTTPETTADLNNAYVYYMNTASNTTFSLTSTENQTIQISKPYIDTQQGETVGYGKWIDNSTNLVKVECLIDGTLKQRLSFDGFDTTANNAGTAERTNHNSNTFNYFDSPVQSDIYSAASTKGFRIKGTVNLNNISSVLTNIGPAKNTVYQLKYDYIRDSDVGGSSSSTTHNIYIDTLSSNPSISANTTTAEVKSVIYTMGIPSVKTMDIDFTRTYSNINSSNQYIPGNRKIASITDIAKVNKPTDKHIYLDRADINTTGEYSYTDTQMETETSSYYHAAYYDESVISESGTNLNISEKVYSLKNTISVTNTLLVDHHFDRDSYNSYGSSSISSKLTLSNIYEITNTTEIAKLNTNVGDIGVTEYNNHSNIVKDWTLLYYKGKFRTNANSTYPNITNYTWDSVSVPNKYSAGGTAYSLTGSSDANGYKWIVFKLSMNDKSSTNIAGTITYYYDVYTYLTGKGFSASTVSKIRDPANNDVVAFVQQTVSSAVRVGNLGRNVKASDLWYGKSSNVSYDTMANGTAKAAYGCRYPASSPSDTSTYWGPMLDINNGNDTIYLFLGLKNTVSLN